MRGSSATFAALALAMTLGEGHVRAESHSCEQGRPCELGAKPPASSFVPGKVDGAAVWQSDGYANVWFTTTKREPTTYKVAVCNAAQVEEVKFEGGPRKDTKVASPKGRLSGCDLYRLQTGMHIDGLRIKPHGNAFKLFVLKDDEASGYSIYLEEMTLPAREGHYKFRMSSRD
ncbi:MAG TPA: hypothetical protein VI197_10055 [Polyangiaceae bacterium]